jgi:hypothetical protein
MHRTSPEVPSGGPEAVLGPRVQDVMPGGNRDSEEPLLWLAVTCPPHSPVVQDLRAAVL